MRVGWKAATNDKTVASFRYRTLMPIATLKSRGHDVEVAQPDKLLSYDAVVFSKSYRKADHQLARDLKEAGRQVVFDICDNHFYNPYNLASYRSARNELLEMIAIADTIVCSTPELARILLAESGTTKPVSVVGDAAELVALPPRPEQGRKTLLWFGSHGSPNAPCGMNDLLAIEPVLRKLSREQDFRLLVASNNRAKFESLKAYFDMPSDYVEWSERSFPSVLAGADAVVIPLSRNPFVNCKTHNRISLALAAGIPVVADAIESYLEFAPFAYLDNWEEGLREVLSDPARARVRAAGARSHIEKRWTMDRLAGEWETALGLEHRNGVAHATPLVEAAESDAIHPYTNGNGHARSPRRYQGAVDLHHGTTITGWVTQPLNSTRPLEVVLKIEGAIVARDIAQRRRTDLETSGFRKSDCGFALKVPAEFCDGAEREFELVADETWVIETGSRSFEEFHAALPAIRPRPQPIARTVAEPEAEAEDWALDADKIKTSLTLATNALADNAAELASVALQKRLFADLEQLNAAVETVKRIAARMILSAADQNEPGQENPRLSAVKRERLGNGDSVPSRTLS